MTLSRKYGKLALVAGASEGIGAAFSTFLASSGMDLVLVARRKGPLDELAASLTERYGVAVDCICCDLALPLAAHQISDALGEREVSLLVYNAALSYIGPFEKNNMEHHEKIAQVNMITPMKLLHIFGESMLHRGRGAIVLMASLAGFQGSGFLAAYAATKAFNRVLAESLWYEWKNRGVDVIACCAGATATENYLRTNPGNPGFFAPRVLDPEEVVMECMEQLGRKPSFIAGQGNRLASFIMQKVLSRKAAINIMGDTTRRMYRL